MLLDAKRWLEAALGKGSRRNASSYKAHRVQATALIDFFKSIKGSDAENEFPSHSQPSKYLREKMSTLVIVE